MMHRLARVEQFVDGCGKPLFLFGLGLLILVAADMLSLPWYIPVVVMFSVPLLYLTAAITILSTVGLLFGIALVARGIDHLVNR